MRVYVAMPYTQGDPQANTDAAIDAAEEVARLGHTPYCPHLTHYWELRHHHEYQFWLDYDLKWLDLCDAILRLPGTSAGADAEVEYALVRKKPVFYSLKEIP